MRHALVTGLTAAIVTALGVADAFSQAPAATIQLPTVVVTAQKEPADLAKLPVSVTAVPKSTLMNAGVTVVSEAGQYSPNTFFTEFTARKLSNARYRGIGSSPANPGVTTYFDGVPQLNANTSSIDLLDVEQVEFVRGPQSALFGRNTLGGLVNIVSSRPSLSTWTGSFSAPFANAGAKEIRASAGGPVVSGRVGAAVSLVYGQRDGFTTNAITGNDLDSREAFSAKGQLLWTPAANWETRVILNGERARDGDYALNDLGALRSRPFTAARDFEGYTHRDLFGTTILNRREGGRIALTTTTGFVSWKTEDATDLDYTPLPLLRRNNAEEAFQFTQEVRVASAANAPVQLSDSLALRWQAGVFFFTQNYEQNAVNSFAPFLLSPFIPFAVTQQSPLSTLDDVGIGLFGQGTLALSEQVDLTAGLRFDHEQKEGVLTTSFSPQIAAATNVSAEEGFSNVSPQVSVAYRPDSRVTVYAGTSRGFKAGGFNPASPPGSEIYGQELTWHLEGGVKTVLMNGRLALNAAVFTIDWADMQLNRPNLLVQASSILPTWEAPPAGAWSSRRRPAWRPWWTCSARWVTRGRDSMTTARRAACLWEATTSPTHRQPPHPSAHRSADESRRTSSSSAVPNSCPTAHSSTTTSTSKVRMPTRSRTSGSVPATGSCSRRPGSATRSIRATSRWPLPTARWRHRGTSANWAGRGRLG